MTQMWQNLSAIQSLEGPQTYVLARVSAHHCGTGQRSPTCAPPAAPSIRCIDSATRRDAQGVEFDRAIPGPILMPNHLPLDLLKVDDGDVT